MMHKWISFVDYRCCGAFYMNGEHCRLGRTSHNVMFVPDVNVQYEFTTIMVTPIEVLLPSKLPAFYIWKCWSHGGSVLHLVDLPTIYIMMHYVTWRNQCQKRFGKNYEIEATNRFVIATSLVMNAFHPRKLHAKVIQILLNALLGLSFWKYFW